MKCQRTSVAEGFAFVCGMQTRRRTCSSCGELAATKLCDGPLHLTTKRKTCDAPLCVKCARHRAGDVDYCPSCDDFLTRASEAEAFANDEKGRP